MGNVDTAKFRRGDGLLVRRSTELDRLGDEEEKNSDVRTKRRRVDKSKFYWNQDQNLYTAALSPAHEALRQQISVHSDNIKGALKDLDVILNKPSLPKAQWTNVLLDNYVDFDKITSHSFTTEAEDQGFFLVGNTTLEFKKPKVVSKINSHAQWISAFRTYEQAVLFAFKGREFELRGYSDHINNLFAATHVSLHHRVINYDRAARIYIGSRRDVLLHEVEKFNFIRIAHIDAGGVAVVGSSSNVGFGKSVQKRKHSPEICRNWNFRTCTREKCVFKHVCIHCGSADHVARECQNRGGKAT
ncbi:hypothetical protein GYMLUDRAFT_153648 [Collybiopsis luxurians FD-317 M1]|nr:hypothetical protein GYMLUDRAFT_153648 [Collybiopsis luxurians FD-317 M1]